MDKKATTGQQTFARQVALKETRKRKAQRKAVQSIWFGFGMFGLIGWAMVAPILLGTMLGLWLDEHFPGTHAWTLNFLVVGLLLGCINAWRWIAKEHQKICEDQEDKDA
ncbi:MAG: F0F1 ATP synthase subunit [Methylococcaceae bacterium]|nr:MAG: F0F1 ATP synthase subunit [Methylococcaceae bacterium]